MIQGRVIYISPDTQTDERTGDPCYALKIRVPSEELAKLGTMRLQPGMPADVLIKTGSQSALQYVLKPFEDMLSQAFREK